MMAMKTILENVRMAMKMLINTRLTTVVGTWTIMMRLS